MRKEYRCSECSKQCSTPIYFRLHLTACGYRSASEVPRWQRSIPVGHICDECLLARVRTAAGHDFDSSLVEGRSGDAGMPNRLRTQKEPS